MAAVGKGISFSRAVENELLISALAAAVLRKSSNMPASSFKNTK